MGGPDGGNGGDGGDVYFQTDGRLKTFAHLDPNKLYKAGQGKHGKSRNQRGADGEDLVIKIPIGTVAHIDGLGMDFTGNVKERILTGGRGGKGNAVFKSSTQQAPRRTTPGETTEPGEVSLELKLIADVGLVGFPNAGKSTLLRSISNARPRVAPYPFTTLEPSLGVVQYADYKSLVVADIPGIIEGAADGAGLGLHFLRHIERTRVLVILIDGATGDPRREYEILIKELDRYSDKMTAKACVTVINKIDLLDAEELMIVKSCFEKDALYISGKEGLHTDALIDKLVALYEKESH